jgi:16S rRNA (cytosine1402-N4)-methyltransferase
VDCTLGFGGHTAALLDAGAGRVIGVDRDAQALAEASRLLADRTGRLTLVHGNFRALESLLAARGIAGVDGILADLGVSSRQLDDPARGFSFRSAGPIDMRMDQSRGPTLAEKLTQVNADELATVIWRFGEERHSRRIARAIVQARDRGELSDTTRLAAVVRRAAGGRGWQRIDPATRTFQALRIWVNEELEGLDTFLEEAARRLSPGGRLAIIAFHSLEDRIVKQTFRQLAEPGSFAVVTRRPTVPDEAERARNPRARSARLRVLERLA